MTRDEALSFLKRNQPLPGDDVLETDVIQTFDEVRRYFLDHPHPACVGYFLNAFGDGDGFGVYQLVEDTIAKQDRVTVIAELTRALGNRSRDIRYWCCQIAEQYLEAPIIERLIVLLDDVDHDVKTVALIALASAKSEIVRKHVLEFAAREPDPDLRSLAIKIAGR